MLNKRLSRLMRRSSGLGKAFHGMVARANAARDEHRYRDAAIIYGEALRLYPDDAGIHVQCGHMHKEAGEYAAAEEHYLRAAELLPADADLALQLGHFFKLSGRPGAAIEAYQRACKLAPDWSVPGEELDRLRRAGWRDRHVEEDVADIASPAGTRDIFDFSEEAAALGRTDHYDRLVPELCPRRPEDMLQAHHEHISIRRFGRQLRTAWGLLPTLRGVEAIRGFVISNSPILEIQVVLNGETIAREPLKGGYPLAYEKESRSLRKYVFNVWRDFSGFTPGRHEIELRFLAADGDVRRERRWIAIAAPLTEAEHPRSDGVVDVDPADLRPIDEQINARASIVRPAQRQMLGGNLRNVLVLRTDQLGDVVSSVPALRRLRALMPEANIVGLLTSANVDLARSLNLFDELIVVDFPDDWNERRRTMTIEAQEQLRKRLEPYEFDLAIDMAESAVSRPLLLLSGARFLYGFYDREWPWLDAGYEGNAHDPKNYHDFMPQSSKVLGLIERLGTMLESKAEIVTRPDLRRDRVTVYGIGETAGFAVLHTGARIVFSRWPYYPELAARLLAETDLTVVMMADNQELRNTLPPELLANERFKLLDMRLPFDDFDALLSHCDVFVGNDSGPKHLASLRGANVVSLHSARVNWNDWGQEHGGVIISRRVPCAGCMLFHEADECGKDFACIRLITTDEVVAAVKAQL